MRPKQAQDLTRGLSVGDGSESAFPIHRLESSLTNGGRACGGDSRRHDGDGRFQSRGERRNHDSAGIRAGGQLIEPIQQRFR